MPRCGWEYASRAYDRPRRAGGDAAGAADRAAAVTSAGVSVLISAGDGSDAARASTADQNSLQSESDRRIESDQIGQASEAWPSDPVTSGPSVLARTPTRQALPTTSKIVTRACAQENVFSRPRLSQDLATDLAPARRKLRRDPTVKIRPGRPRQFRTFHAQTASLPLRCRSPSPRLMAARPQRTTGRGRT